MPIPGPSPVAPQVLPYVPCGWAPTPIPGGPCCDAASTDPAIVTQANAIATAMLFMLTGRQFGACPITVRPCIPQTCDPLQLSRLIYWDARASRGYRDGNLGVLSYIPTLLDGQIYNLGCGLCPTNCCNCKADCRVLLPGPVQSIVNVTVDGVVLDPSFYRVQNGNTLIFNHVLLGNANYAADLVTENALGTLEATRPDSPGVTATPFVPNAQAEAKYASYCPPCQDYNLAAGEIGTWSVTYNIGTPVPNEANFAAGLYALEVAKSLLGDKSCGLPERVQAVTRQGITTVYFDPTKLLNMGLTGIVMVDQIVSALNPNKMTQASRVWFPGKHNVNRDT